jgi:hypothetical protein
MKQTVVLAAIVTTVLIAPSAGAQNGNPLNTGSANTETIAVFGDWPYSPQLLQAAPLLVDSINSDPKVRLVVHVGDIHSGSMPCIGAGLDPLPRTSNPLWNEGIFGIFEQFRNPLIYTPGDNEWTDCHKTQQGTSGDPLRELAAVRSLFFGNPGYSLGGQKKRVVTQAYAFDPAFPADAQFVENVMWEESQVVFVTLNVPGSNNDTLPWNGGSTTVPGNAPYSTSNPFVPPFLNETARAHEVSERTGANSRWLGRAFALADADHTSAVMVIIQADMWDTTAALTAYTPFVQQLADLSVHFGRPVLLVNGDSHLFGADHPLANPASGSGAIHHTQAVPNLTRITVQGSTNIPHEWLRLTIDPRWRDVFSWTNVIYCDQMTCPQ